MLRYLPYFIILFLSFGMVTVLQSYRPEILDKLLISVDVFGISTPARDEQQRQSRINALAITYEEKQVLIKHTVFLGASTDMVRLALGEPNRQRVVSGQNSVVEDLIYYLSGDKRPTILELNNNKLEKAYKGSTIDLID